MNRKIIKEKSIIHSNKTRPLKTKNATLIFVTKNTINNDEIAFYIQKIVFKLPHYLNFNVNCINITCYTLSTKPILRTII